MELVSVVVAIYNQEDFLGELITSICKQSYCALQIILVDDGSTDHSPAICDEYGAKDERILVVHKENGGVSSARNAGLLAAEGKYIFVLDGDDILTSDYCARMVEAQQANPDSFVLCGYEEFDEKTGRVVTGRGTNGKEATVVYEKSALAELVNETFIHIPWNKIYERDIIKRCGLRYDEEVSNSEDYIFNMQYLKMKNPSELVMIAEPLYRYRKHGKTTLSGRYYEDMFDTKKNEIALLAGLEKEWGIAHTSEFYKRALHCLETAVLNYMRPENPMSYSEKIRTCNKVLRSGEYKMYLKKCGSEMSFVRYAVCKSGSAALFDRYIAFCRSRRKAVKGNR